MKRLLRYLLAAAMLFAVSAIVLYFVFRGETASGEGRTGTRASSGEVKSDGHASRRAPKSERVRAESAEGGDEVEETVESDDAEAEEESPAEPMTEEEKREEAEDQLVEAFDNLTDTWQDAAADKVTMQAVNNFHEQFNKVPKGHREECLQRALNLIPDENVMLLAGILFDKTQDPEVLEAIYNDILNRDEDVKKPILEQIFKDKEHPCWADTAWILDVTGDTPEKKDEEP